MNAIQTKFRELVEDGVSYVPAGRDDARLLRVIRELVKIHNDRLKSTLGEGENMGFHCVNDIVRSADIFRALVLAVRRKRREKEAPKYLEAGAGTGFFTAIMSSLGDVQVKAAEQDPESLEMARDFLGFLGFRPEFIEERDLLEDPVTKSEFMPDILFAEQICGDTGTEHFHRVMQAQARDRGTLTIPYAVQPVLGGERKKLTSNGWQSMSLDPSISSGAWMILADAEDPHLRINAELSCHPRGSVDLTVGLNIRWLQRGYQVRRLLAENMENAIAGKPYDASLCVPNPLSWHQDPQKGRGVVTLYNPSDEDLSTRVKVEWPYGWRSARDTSKRWANVSVDPPVKLGWRYPNSLDLIEGSD